MCFACNVNRKSFCQNTQNKDAPVTSKTLFRHLKRGNICVSNSGSVQIYNAIFLKRKTVKKIWNIFKFMFLFKSILIFFTSTYIFTTTSRLPPKKNVVFQYSKIDEYVTNIPANLHAIQNYRSRTVFWILLHSRSVRCKHAANNEHKVQLSSCWRNRINQTRSIAFWKWEIGARNESTTFSFFVNCFQR